MSLPAPMPSDRPMRTAALRSASDFRLLRNDVDLLVFSNQSNAQFIGGFAISKWMIEKAQRLRFKVFNEELGEGLMTSRESGIDADEYDEQMAHLVLVNRATEEVVGTYRLQTFANGFGHQGVYSARQYDITPLESIFGETAECGRACIAQGFRTPELVFLLWKGIGAFMDFHEQRYVCGCCSITTLNPDDGWRAMKTLRGIHALHPTYLLPPMPAYSCGDPSRETDGSVGRPMKLPKLFTAYMRLGGHVASLPAIDREFGTVDFLVFLDSKVVSLSAMLEGRG